MQTSSDRSRRRRASRVSFTTNEQNGAAASINRRSTRRRGSGSSSATPTSTSTAGTTPKKKRTREESSLHRKELQAIAYALRDKLTRIQTKNSRNIPGYCYPTASSSSSSVSGSPGSSPPTSSTSTSPFLGGKVSDPSGRDRNLVPAGTYEVVGCSSTNRRDPNSSSKRTRRSSDGDEEQDGDENEDEEQDGDATATLKKSCTGTKPRKRNNVRDKGKEKEKEKEKDPEEEDDHDDGDTVDDHIGLGSCRGGWDGIEAKDPSVSTSTVDLATSGKAARKRSNNNKKGNGKGIPLRQILEEDHELQLIKSLMNLKKHSDRSDRSSEPSSPNMITRSTSTSTATSTPTSASTSTSSSLSDLSHTFRGGDGPSPEIQRLQGRDRQLVHIFAFVHHLYHFLPVRGIRPNDDDDLGGALNNKDEEVDCANADELAAFVRSVKAEQDHWYNTILNLCLVQRNERTLRINAALALGALTLRDYEFASSYYRKCCRTLKSLLLDEPCIEVAEALMLMSYYAYCQPDAPEVGNRYRASYLALLSLEHSRCAGDDPTLRTCALRTWILVCDELGSCARYSAQSIVMRAYFPQLVRYSSVHYDRFLRSAIGLVAVFTQFFLLKYFNCTRQIPWTDVQKINQQVEMKLASVENQELVDSHYYRLEATLQFLCKDLLQSQMLGMSTPGEEVLILQALLHVAIAQYHLAIDQHSDAREHCIVTLRIMDEVKSFAISEHAVMAHFTPALDILASSNEQTDVVLACRWMFRLGTQFMLEDAGDASFVWESLKDKISRLMSRERFMGAVLD